MNKPEFILEHRNGKWYAICTEGPREGELVTSGYPYRQLAMTAAIRELWMNGKQR